MPGRPPGMGSRPNTVGPMNNHLACIGLILKILSVYGRPPGPSGRPHALGFWNKGIFQILHLLGIPLSLVDLSQGPVDRAH